MTPQELKNSILQLAIQGKLVEQRPEEGTAEELYRKIQEEKKRLIKERKLKKEKPLLEIAEVEKPFEIPRSWKWGRFGEMSQFLDGEKLQGISYPYLEAKYLRGKSDAIFVTGGKFVHNGTKVILVDGENSGEVFHVPEDGYMGSTFKALYYSSSMFEPYVLYFLLYHKFDYRNNKKGSAIPHLNKALFFNMPIPIPPFEEQARIVAKIEEILPYIDRYEQAWNRLEDFNKRFPVDMQKSLLQWAIQGKLVEQRPEERTAEGLYRQIQEEKQRLIKAGKLKKTKALPPITEKEIPAEFPDKWKICYIDDIAFVTKLAGFEYTKNVAPNLATNGIPLFKGKNVQNGKLVLKFESFIPEMVSNALPRSQILKKCLLTPYVGTIGNIAIFDGSFKAHLGANVGKIELLNGKQEYIMEEYVLYYLRSNIGYEELTKYKKATAQESISIDAIRNVIIAIPPLAEQKRIVARLEELLPLCERLK